MLQASRQLLQGDPFTSFNEPEAPGAATSTTGPQVNTNGVPAAAASATTVPVLGSPWAAQQQQAAYAQQLAAQQQAFAQQQAYAQQLAAQQQAYAQQQQALAAQQAAAQQPAAAAPAPEPRPDPTTAAIPGGDAFAARAAPAAGALCMGREDAPVALELRSQ